MKNENEKQQLLLTSCNNYNKCSDIQSYVQMRQQTS